MMLLNSSRTIGRRLVAVALTIALILPTPATVSRADDELLPPATETPVPTATPTAAPTNTPAPQPSNTPVPAKTPVSEAPARNLPPAPGLNACVVPPGVAPTTWELAGNPPVNDMLTTVQATFKAVEARDLGLTGQIVGFRPGVVYAHIYARDSATIAPSAQYFYDLPYLTRPVEEFLALQFDGSPGDAEDVHWRTPAKPGAVSGTIGGGEIAGAKMLVVSDEEPSVVTMAYFAAKAGAGEAWLRQEQAGRPRIQRLNEAMDWIFQNRFDQQVRSIKRGNTTDWGDVAVGQGHSSGSYTKEPDDWTASIYDQAWNYRALQQLAELNQMVGQHDIAEHQLSRARLLRQSVAERFWQQDRGYFRTRIVLPPLPREFDEDSIVSIA